MKVHSFGDDFNDVLTTGVPTGQRELLPDGTHSVTIREATEGPSKFPNTPGLFLHLTFAPNGAYGLIWVSLGSGEKDRALAGLLAHALGFNADSWADCDPAELVGREVQITTKQVFVARSGKTRCFINDYLPAIAAVAPKPAARLPAQKVAAARGEEAGEADDIPF